MNNPNDPASTRSRRGVLRGAAVGGAALAATGLLPAGKALAGGSTGGGYGGVTQVPGITTVIDTSHASHDVAELFSAYFRRKSAKDVEGTMSFFSHELMNYTDAILGWPFNTWQQLHDLFAHYMPTWPANGTSSPVRILGDTTSAVVFFTNSAGLFGPSEMRAAGVVNFDRRGKITRWVDYWDGRHFGVANLDSEKNPPDTFAQDFKESTVGETAAGVLRNVATRLVAALRDGDGATAASLFAYDAVFEDVTAHLLLNGPRSIGAYLTAAAGVLPYTGPHLALRHTAGSVQGGGFEWIAKDTAVPRGFNALELDVHGKITRFTGVWDGSLATDQTFVTLAQRAIEH